MGAAFGSGARAVCLARRARQISWSRTTGILAAVFFVTSLTLAYVVPVNQNDWQPHAGVWLSAACSSAFHCRARGAGGAGGPGFKAKEIPK